MKKIAKICSFSFSSDSSRYELPQTFKNAKTRFLDNCQFRTYQYSFILPRKISYTRAWLLSGVYSPFLVYNIIKKRVDLIYCGGIDSPWQFAPFFIGKFMRKPVVAGDNHWYWSNTLAAKICFPVNRFMVMHSSLLFLTKGAGTFWEKTGVSANKMRISAPPDYVPKLDISNDDLMKAEKIRKNLNLYNKKVVLFFGQLITKKGVEYLLRAFGKLSTRRENLTLLICGDGPEMTNLRMLTEEMGITSNTYFLGYIKSEEKNAFFLVCDIFVYPSITTSIPEEWPLAVCEAMSVGKPVVVTNAVGSSRESQLVMHSVNGFVVPEKDWFAIFKTLDALLVDSDLAVKIGQKAKATLEENFSYDKCFEDLRAFLNEGLLLC